MTEFDQSIPRRPRRPRRSATRHELEKLTFLDLEASGLASGSWPIEIGFARIALDGAIVSVSQLIRPDPGWSEDHWSSQSAGVHGIPRRALDAAPTARDVAQWAMDQMAGRIAVSDAPSYDGRWLTMLLRIVDPEPLVRMVDFNHLVAMTYDYEGVRRVYQTLDALPVPHRAAADAERLARAFIAGKTP